MASACLPLRNSALPDSRSLVMLAERFWLTGIGGGGTSVSMFLKALWRSFRALSSSCRAREALLAEMTLEAGSMWRGRRVKVSVSSILAVLLSRTCTNFGRRGSCVE